MNRSLRVLCLVVCLQSTKVAVAALPEDVITWTKAGVPDAEIIKRVRAAEHPGPFSAHDALRLKSSGVSDDVLRALIAVAEPDPTPKVAEPPEAQVEPKRVVEPEKRGIIVRSAKDIILAWEDGATEDELIVAVRGLNLQFSRMDRFRLNHANVPYSVVRAATSSWQPSPQRRTVVPDEDGNSIFGTFEVAGGFGSVSSGDTTVSAGRVVPGVHAIIARALSLGVELDLAFGTGDAQRIGFFGVAGFGVAGKSTLFRAAVRLGVHDDGESAYGFELAGMGRAGGLLAGIGVTGTWAGDPAVSAIAADLRIGTWF